MSGKKVCFISQNIYPLIAKTNHTGAGGAELQQYLLAKELRNKDFDVIFIVDNFGQNEIEIIDGFELYKAPFRYMGGSKFYLIPDCSSLCGIMDRVNSDIYLIKAPRSLLWLIAFYCKLRNKKSIFISSSDSDSDLNYIVHNDGLSRFLYYLGIRLVDLVVAQTQRQKRQYRNNLNREAIVIKNIFPGKENMMKKNSDSVVLWVGSNRGTKRPRLFLELAKRIPEARFKMLIAPGADNPDLKLEHDAEKVKNLEYIGFIPYNEIDRYYTNSSILVNTSNREGFPNVFLQAWIHHTAVVSLNIDPDGIIKGQKLGFCSESFERLIEDVRTLLKNRKLREQMGNNGFRYVKSEHNPAIVADQYIQLFKSLLE